VGGLIFCTASGKPMSYQNLIRIWNHICEISGVQKTMHTFRHTFATVALSKGIPILEVSRCLGHADASTTLDMYGHAIPSYNEKLLDQFSPGWRKKKDNNTEEIRIRRVK